MSSPCIEVGHGPTNHIHGGSYPSKGQAGIRPVETSGRVVWQYDAKIQIAIGAIITARDRSEQVDPLGIEELDETARDFLDRFLL